MIKICYLWRNANVLWKDANWTWSECQLVEEIIAGNPPGVDAETLIQPWMKEIEEPWDPYKEEKRRRWIKLICKVKGKKYDEEKEVKDFKVTVDDIKMVVKAMTNIDLKLKE